MKTITELLDQAERDVRLAHTSLQRLDQLYADQAETNDRLANVRALIKGTEAEIAANGGWNKYLIDGPNAEVRKGQYQQALDNHPGYAALNKEARELEKAKAILAGSIDTADGTIRLCERSIQLVTASIQLKTARETPVTMLRRGDETNG